MKFYKSPDNKVFAYEANGSQDAFIPESLTPINQEEADRLRKAILTAAQRIAMLTTSIQAHLDAAAQALGYDDIKTAVTYAEEPAVPKFQAEGRALRAWRSLVWAKSYETLAKWEAGQIEEPTLDAVIEGIPAYDPQGGQPL